MLAGVAGLAHGPLSRRRLSRRYQLAPARLHAAFLLPADPGSPDQDTAFFFHREALARSHHIWKADGGHGSENSYWRDGNLDGVGEPQWGRRLREIAGELVSVDAGFFAPSRGTAFLFSGPHYWAVRPRGSHRLEVRLHLSRSLDGRRALTVTEGGGGERGDGCGLFRVPQRGLAELSPLPSFAAACSGPPAPRSCDPTGAQLSFMSPRHPRCRSQRAS